MTERLYYYDSLLTEFEAEITGIEERNGGWECTLDRSAFYPTSGGQPYDTGTLTLPSGETAKVTDVQIARDGEIIHKISRMIPVGTRVKCTIDRERRRDHMEQHGGEHLLAGAVWRLLSGTTIGLHLGAEDSTIDVSFPDGRTHLNAEEITMLEEQVDRWIRQDAEVKCYFVAPEDVEKVPLRKPPTVKDNIRVVQYGDFEYCACGGTHPPRSGMIGQIKILSALPSKGKVRICFVCGERAEKRLRACFDTLKNASDMLSCHWADTVGAIRLLRARYEEASKETEQRNGIIAGMEADRAEKEAIKTACGRNLAVMFLPFDDRKFLSGFVSAEVQKTGMIVFCALKAQGGERFFCMSCPADDPIDLRRVIALVGAKGGGRPNMVSGVVGEDDLAYRLADALERICGGIG